MFSYVSIKRKTIELNLFKYIYIDFIPVKNNMKFTIPL